MPVVTGTLLDVEGDPVQGIVTLRLITSVDGSRPPAFLAGGVTIISQVQPAVAIDGDWSADLIANSLVTPLGSYYEFIGQALRQPARGFAFVVPDASGPHNVTDLAVIDPLGPIPPSALAAHLAADPAHSAAKISVTPFASVSATNAQDALEEIIADLPGGDSYTWSQPTAAPVWGPIPHNFGRIPSDPYVVESTGDTLEPGREDPDLNTTILDFDGVSVSGDAHFS